MEAETGIFGQQGFFFFVVYLRKGFECQGLLPFVFSKGNPVGDRRGLDLVHDCWFCVH